MMTPEELEKTRQQVLYEEKRRLEDEEYKRRTAEDRVIDMRRKTVANLLENLGIIVLMLIGMSIAFVVTSYGLKWYWYW